MRRRYGVVGFICVLSAMVAGPACGDDDSGPSVPLEEVEDAYLDFYCQAVLDCDMGWAPLFDTVAECRDFMTLFERGMTSIGEIVDAVNQGSADYSPTRGGQCLSDLAALGCDVFASPDPDACRETFTGLTANGQSCRLHDECVSGWCDTRGSCPGECAQPVGDGDSCADELMCDIGLVCFDDVCEPHPGPLAAGQHCDPDLAICAHGHYCDEQTAVCTALKQGGDDCDPDSSVEECGPGMMCVDSVCVALQLVETEGENCDPFTGLICNPGLGLGCVMDFTDPDAPAGTTCRPFGGQGDDCLDLQNRLFMPCDDFAGFYCNRQTQVCETQKAGGELCTEGEECLSGICNGTSGVCDAEPCWQQ